MAAIAETRGGLDREERFFFTMAGVMAALLVAGFSLNIALGRSSFASPWPVHLHALVFFGWTTLYLLQSGLVATGNVALHRRLGWLSLAWIPAMVILGTYVTVAMVRRGGVPFFFTPGYFLVMDPVMVLAFAGIAGAGILNRRRTDWHRRLMFCAMAGLTGPAWGRLLPMPFIIPYAGAASLGAGLIFPLIGMARDVRVQGRVHPAWFWGAGAMALSILLVEMVVRSPLAPAVYALATAGSHGATVAPFAYPAPPPL